MKPIDPIDTDPAEPVREYCNRLRAEANRAEEEWNARRTFSPRLWDNLNADLNTWHQRATIAEHEVFELKAELQRYREKYGPLDYIGGSKI